MKTKQSKRPRVAEVGLALEERCLSDNILQHLLDALHGGLEEAIEEHGPACRKAFLQAAECVWLPDFVVESYLDTAEEAQKA
jgi:hypothetical protein